MVLANQCTSPVPRLKVMYLAYLASRCNNDGILRGGRVRFEILVFFQSQFHCILGLSNFKNGAYFNYFH